MDAASQNFPQDAWKEITSVFYFIRERKVKNFEVIGKKVLRRGN
jgi:hypothetical protein